MTHTTIRHQMGGGGMVVYQGEVGYLAYLVSTDDFISGQPLKVGQHI